MKSQEKREEVVELEVSWDKMGVNQEVEVAKGPERREVEVKRLE